MALEGFRPELQAMGFEGCGRAASSKTSVENG